MTHYRMLSLFLTLGRHIAQESMPIWQLIRCSSHLILPGASSKVPDFGGGNILHYMTFPRCLYVYMLLSESVLKGNKEFRSEEGGREGGTHTQHIYFISDANTVTVQDNPGQPS